jgi:hypothetical protein
MDLTQSKFKDLLLEHQYTTNATVSNHLFSDGPHLTSVVNEDESLPITKLKSYRKSIALYPFKSIMTFDEEIMNQLISHSVPTIINTHSPNTILLVDSVLKSMFKVNNTITADELQHLIVYHNCEDLVYDNFKFTFLQSLISDSLDTSVTLYYRKLSLLNPVEYLFIVNSDRTLSLIINEEKELFGLLIYPDDKYNLYTNHRIVRVHTLKPCSNKTFY